MKDLGLSAVAASVFLVTIFLVIVFITPALVLISRGFDLGNELFGELAYVVYISIATSLISATLAVATCIPMAFYFSKKHLDVTRRVVFPILMVPALLSPSAVGSLLLLFFTENPLGRYVNAVVRIVNDLKGVVIAQFIVTLPLTFTYYLALFSSIPRVYEEVAMEAGLGSLGYLYRVLVPMTKNQVISGYALSFARAFADFGASLIVGGGIRGRTWTLPIYVYFATQFGGVTVLALVLLVYTLIAITVYTVLVKAAEVVKV